MHLLDQKAVVLSLIAHYSILFYVVTQLSIVRVQMTSALLSILKEPEDKSLSNASL